MMLGEQDPLLGCEAGTSEQNKPQTSRQKAAYYIDSAPFHRTVIFLITVDAVCVLADLGYTFLSDGCNPPGGAEAPAWLEVLAHISLVITSFFLVEIPLALWAFGLRYYNPFGDVPHAMLHIFDALIIITTFVLEVALKGRERELAGLLVVLRLWRLVKLVGGIAVGAGELGEEEAKALAQTERKLASVQSELSATRQENQRLNAQLASLRGVSEIGETSQ